MKEGSTPAVGVYSWGCCTFLNMDSLWIKCHFFAGQSTQAGSLERKSPEPEAVGSDAAEGLQRCCDHHKGHQETPGSQFYNFLQEQPKFLSCEAKYLLFFPWGGFASHPNLTWAGKLLNSGPGTFCVLQLLCSFCEEQALLPAAALWLFVPLLVLKKSGGQPCRLNEMKSGFALFNSGTIEHGVGGEGQ